MRLGLAVLILYCRDCQVDDAAHLHTERALSCVRGSQTFDRSSQLHYLSGFALKLKSKSEIFSLRHCRCF